MKKLLAEQMMDVATCHDMLGETSDIRLDEERRELGLSIKVAHNDAPADL